MLGHTKLIPRILEFDKGPRGFCLPGEWQVKPLARRTKVAIC